MAAAAIIAGWSLWGARRQRPLGEVSLVPWGGILFVSLVALCAAGAHLLSLLTGQPVRPRGL